MINSKMIYRIIGFLLLIETAMLLCCGAVSLFLQRKRFAEFPDFIRYHHRRRYIDACNWQRCGKVAQPS